MKEAFEKLLQHYQRKIVDAEDHLADPDSQWPGEDEHYRGELFAYTDIVRRLEKILESAQNDRLFDTVAQADYRHLTGRLTPDQSR